MTSNLSIPYTKIKANWKEFIAPEDFPENVKFNHPSRYRAAATHAILQLYQKQQANGQQPFQFRATLTRKGNPEPANYANGILLAATTTNNVKSAKEKERRVLSDPEKSCELEDTYYGDDSVSLSDSVSEESRGSNDWPPSVAVMCIASTAIALAPNNLVAQILPIPTIAKTA